MKTLTNNDIARAIYLSTKDKEGAHLKDELKKVTQFLARRRLISKSKEILSSLQTIINQKEGIIIAKVSSAEKITQKTHIELMHLLKKRYGAKEVKLEEELDVSLIRGVRIEVGDEVIDLSIKNKIGQLQAYLARQ
jgi:F-type H+-transporting ATPase subunit delta